MADIRLRFVEFETAGDLKVAVEKLDGQEFKGANVRCEADVSDARPSPYCVYLRCLDSS